jgi:hypothetical protein
MKNRHKHLWILTLVSLIWGATTVYSHADQKDKGTKDAQNVKKEVIVKQEENTKGNTTSQESKNKEKDREEPKKKKEKVVRPPRQLRRATGEEKIKFTGDIIFEGAHNIGLMYPAKTDFYPSLIITDKTKKKQMEVFDLDVLVKLGASKKFIFEDEVCKGELEVRLAKDKVWLSQIFLTWQGWVVGITKNNFGTIATFPGAKVSQISWQKNINEMLTLGLGLEEAKKFSFCGKDEEGEKEAKKIRLKTLKGYLPASSGRIQYNLPNKLGSIELSGLFRTLGWFDGDKFKFMPGYGLNLGSKINIKPETDTLTVHAMFGEGIGEYIADMNILESEPISVYIGDAGKKVKSIKASGVYAAYEHYWTPFLHSTLEAGLTSILNDDRKAEKPDYYKLGLYGKGNLVYRFTEHTSVGVEYGVGYRGNADESRQKSKGANHIKAIFEFKI